MTVENKCSALNRASLSISLRFRDHHARGNRKRARARFGWSAMKCSTLDVAVATQELRAAALTCIRLAQDHGRPIIPAWVREGLMREGLPTPRAIGN